MVLLTLPLFINVKSISVLFPRIEIIFILFGIKTSRGVELRHSCNLGGAWGTECIHTRFFFLTLLEYLSVKLKLKLFILQVCSESSASESSLESSSGYGSQGAFANEDHAHPHLVQHPDGKEYVVC